MCGSDSEPMPGAERAKQNEQRGRGIPKTVPALFRRMAFPLLGFILLAFAFVYLLPARSLHGPGGMMVVPDAAEPHWDDVKYDLFFGRAPPRECALPTPTKPPAQPNRWIESLPYCSWATPEHYKYPYQANTPEYVETIRMLNQADIKYMLIEGALIGAYRHGGPLPCDQDLDIVLPAWLNLIENPSECADAAVPTLRGYERGDEGALTLCGWTRDKYLLLRLRSLFTVHLLANILTGIYHTNQSHNM